MDSEALRIKAYQEAFSAHEAQLTVSWVNGFLTATVIWAVAFIITI